MEVLVPELDLSSSLPGLFSDMNHNQGISIPQGPITRTRAKKLQQTLYSYIQAMMSSTKEILEDVGDHVMQS